jgi:hypothetical protein
MNLTIHGFYTIKDEFFEKFPDPYLKSNKGATRPHYYCFKDDTNILWMIPLSSKVDKYKKIIQKRINYKKNCDILHIVKLANKESVFLIQDMFPIIDKYIEKSFTIATIPLMVKNKMIIRQLDKKSKKVLALIKQGKVLNPTQVDALKIYRLLITELG